MNKKAIKKLARKHGISTIRKTYPELIREIQRSEGNFDCFGSAQDYCDQPECLFRDICLHKPEET